ncbi:MAG: methylmalonyl Co-A mutase-associated GTPase MeaB [Anaerolineae bacterium]
MTQIDGVRTGDRRAIARAITQVERGGREARPVLAQLYPHTGRAQIIGVTGAPGTGKSTLVNRLGMAYRRRDRTVGIVAVDPTSPFSGGAILGDRVRMQALSGDNGIFIRSMATRGSLGGLAWTTRDVVAVLDAAGFDVIIIETVGAGQSEVEIADAAHTTIVVTVPGLGDDIQAVKAGILEIADVFAVNKADLAGVDQAVAQLQTMLNLDPQMGDWRPPVIKTVSTTGDGVPELVDAIEEHYAYLVQSGEKSRRDRARGRSEVLDILRHTLLSRALEGVSRKQFDLVIDQVAERKLDPYTAVEELLRQHNVARK